MSLLIWLLDSCWMVVGWLLGMEVDEYKYIYIYICVCVCTHSFSVLTLFSLPLSLSQATFCLDICI